MPSRLPGALCAGDQRCSAAQGPLGPSLPFLGNTGPVCRAEAPVPRWAPGTSTTWGRAEPRRGRCVF